jgi:hypothetical protein
LNKNAGQYVTNIEKLEELKSLMYFF